MEQGTRKTIIFPDDLWEIINDWRFDNRLGTEAEAVRTLIQMGIHYDKLKKHPEFAQHEANIIEELNNSIAS
jgi:hypothetical protein